jgi:hypothetical protein
MSSVLKGNYETPKKVEAQQKNAPENLEEKFEREVLKRLGGSIAYVSKKKVSWDLKE